MVHLKILCPVCKVQDLVDETTEATCVNCKTKIFTNSFTYAELRDKLENLVEKHKIMCKGKINVIVDVDDHVVVQCQCCYYEAVAYALTIDHYN